MDLETFKWILITAGVIFGGLKVNKLVENYQNRKYKLADRTHDDAEANLAIHETNQTEALKGDAFFRNSLIERITTLETKLEKMQQEQLSQARTNERLTTENEHFKADNTRQQAEITDLKQRNRQLSDRVSELTGLVHRLETRIGELTGQPLEVKLVDGDPIHVTADK